MGSRLKRVVAVLALVIGLSGGHAALSTQQASAHSYWYANWSTCTYDYYAEASRWSGTHGHQYQYSVAMPQNYCTG